MNKEQIQINNRRISFAEIAKLTIYAPSGRKDYECELVLKDRTKLKIAIDEARKIAKHFRVKSAAQSLPLA